MEYKTVEHQVSLQTCAVRLLVQPAVMAQLSQACSCTTAQDTSDRSELVTGVNSYTREHQEKTELVTGIRYAYSRIRAKLQQKSTRPFLFPV